MDTKNSTCEIIKQYIARTSLTDIETIKNDTLIFEQGLLDSMGLLFLIEFIKKEFNVDVNDDELIRENFETVDAISSFTCRKRGICQPA